MSGEKSTSGPVALSKISGHVYSVEGAMLQGADLACYGTETKTLADGFYVLDGFSPGTYEVRVNLQGFKAASKAVSLQEGEEAIVDFRLSKAKGTARIRGHVYDAESKNPVQGGTVILVLPVANKYRHIDRDGYYEFDDLPAGTYKILASIPGYEDRDVLLTVTDDEIKTQDFPCKPQKIEEPPWG